MTNISKEIVFPSGQHFSADIAFIKAYGLHEAFLIHHFQHWIRFNQQKKDKHNFKDGKTWTYQTIESIADHFQFLSYEQVKYAIENLVEKGVLIKGNFNKSKFDRTTWYAFSNEHVFVPNLISLEENSKNIYERENSLSLGKIPSSIGKIPSSIPDTKPDTKTKQQQEASPPYAAVSSKKIKKKPDNLKDPPIKFDFGDLDISSLDKGWLLSKYDFHTLEKAVAWVNHPETIIKKTVIQALKWACEHIDEIKLPLTKEKVAAENKHHAEKVVALAKIPSSVYVYLLNQEIEIGFVGAQSAPTTIRYDEPGFASKLEQALKRYKIE